MLLRGTWQQRHRIHIHTAMAWREWFLAAKPWNAGLISAIQVLKVPFLVECSDSAFERAPWRPSHSWYEVTLDFNQSVHSVYTLKGHYGEMASLMLCQSYVCGKSQCGYNTTNSKPEKDTRKQASSQHHQIYRMFVDLDKACSRLITCEKTKVICKMP